MTTDFQSGEVRAFALATETSPQKPLPAKPLGEALCAVAGEAPWMLAHLDDGVLWGRFERVGDETQLVLPTDGPLAGRAARVCPALRAETVQEIRLFGLSEEVLVRPVKDGLSWRRRSDRGVADAAAGAVPDALDAHVLLWGRQGAAVGPGFAYVDEGAEGFPQVVPLLDADALGAGRRPALRVRTYLTALTGGVGDGPEGRAAGLDARTYRLVDLSWIDPHAHA